MCESKAFVRRGATEELLLDDVAVVEPVAGGYRLKSLFGDEVTLTGRIELLDFMKHRVLFVED